MNASLQTESYRAWTAGVLELIRRASTDLPPDVVAAISASRERETPGSRAEGILGQILDNITLARERSTPICQDTGVLAFEITVPCGMNTLPLAAAVEDAVRGATRLGYLRCNTIDAVSGRSHDDNIGPAFPVLHTRQAACEAVRVELTLKGGGCENVGAQYSLPCTLSAGEQRTDAGRDLEGVRRCVLDALWQAQGRGCAPGVLGVCIGGDRALGYALAKAQFLRRLDDISPDPALAGLEQRLLREANTLGIGPMGMAGKTTLLGVKLIAASRLPASFFVTVSYMCWAFRRRGFEASVDGEIQGWLHDA